ncbi:uncharacterized protein I206_103668 [Kwoniella pini CBS 10737]|uniref:Uncharacterized protein n=1 Tax=Kwoniella pini CBS 10737 TaxID=1296096 RepID=A0A1B9I964_9TREE|nr:uncharacterized protein I206_01331 [Kwoniella pini CBS 10737]OCF52047.1 hypothetical protein I206_01331 [Kwoniella pini CBS 10737]
MTEQNTRYVGTAVTPSQVTAGISETEPKPSWIAKDEEYVSSKGYSIPSREEVEALGIPCKDNDKYTVRVEGRDWESSYTVHEISAKMAHDKDLWRSWYMWDGQYNVHSEAILSIPRGGRL